MECNSREKEILDMATIMKHGLTSHKNSLLVDGNIDNTNPLVLLEYFTTDGKSEGSLKPIETNKISDIFQPFETKDGLTTIPKFILIEGAPGMGKTTLCKEIAYQWAKQSLLNDTKLLLLVYLHDPAISSIKHLKDFIHYFYKFDQGATKSSKQCAKVLNNRNNNDITILFDGYDEFDSSSDSLINDILGREVLPQCRIMVTSRLTASDRLRRIADVRVEVLGFTDKSKIQYIKQELKDLPDKIEMLESYLNDNPSIKSICYMPMMMTILVYVFKEKGYLPNNSIELYDKFVALTISHYLQKQHKSEHLFISPQTLPKEHKSFLTDLSKFAFLMLQSKLKVFNKKDIEKLCPNSTLASSNLDKLGLINSVEYFCTDKGNSCVFNFLHLSIHEYLAAYYISSMDQSIQFNELQNTFFDEMYQEAWNIFIAINKKKWLMFQNYSIYCKDMYCEILSNWIAYVRPSPLLEHLNELYDIVHTNTESTNFIQILFSNTTQCCNDAANAFQNKTFLSLCTLHQTKLELFASDNSNWLKPVIKYLTNKFSIVFYQNHLLLLNKVNPKQIFYLYKIKSLIDHIALLHCHISETMIDAIQFSNLKSLSLIKCTIEHNGAGEYLSSVIFSNTGLKQLILDNNDIGKGMLHIVRALQQLKSLQVLGLSNTNMPKDVTDDLALAIECNQSLNTLYLYGNNLQSSAVIILKALSKISSLKELNLQYIQLTEDASEYLSPVICNNLGLNKLFLDNNDIGKGMLHIVRALQQLNSLQALGLSNTNMPKEVADDLALAIKCNQILNAVQMSNNKLQCSAVVIIQALSKISSLKELNLQSIQLTEDAGEYLSPVICNNLGLNKLFLDNNVIGKGMLHIVRALQQLNSLQALGLSNTNMPKEVTDDLALAIECNQSLNTVQLNNNNLQRSAVMIIQALSKISSLKVLNLRSIQLTEDAGEYLSSVIFSNIGLNQLLLDNNDIGKGMLHIVRALQQLNSLQVLDLSNTNMPKEVTDDLALAIGCNQTLNTLYLYGNNLQSSAVIILKALSKISSLKELNLESIQLTEDASEYLSPVICNNLGLNKLFLDNNDIGKGMLHIVRALQQLNSLQALGLSITNMPKEVADDLALAIECNQSLNIVQLSNNNIQCSAVMIIQALSKISSLKELNLQSIQLTEDAGEYLSPVICNNLGLNKLFLDNNVIGKGMLHIVRALQQLNSLQALGLSNTNMPKEVTDDLALAIECNQSLNTVQLNNNNLQRSAVMIIQALSKISSLKVLNLRSIQLTEDAGEYLSSVIFSNTGLNQLLLDNNDIGKGMLHIVRALQQLNSLQVLDLSNTNMPKEVTDDLALAIGCNQTLNTLYLYGNNLQSSAVIILKALSKISSLKELNLESIQLTEDASEYLSPVICNNLGLNKLFLDNNDIGKGMLHIVRALQQLNSLQALGLSITNMPKEVADDLALAIECNQSLNIVQLSNNNLQCSAVMIIQALSKISSLKELNLQSIQLTEDAGEYLSSVICNNAGLNQLFLDNNNIGKGMLHIIRALQQLNSLLALGLSNTNMPKDVTDDLALAIECNQSLNTVQLNNNNLQRSAVMIIQALSKISSLKVLNLRSNQLTEDAGEYLSSVIFSNTGLNQLLLDNNDIGKGMLHIVRALQQLNSLQALGLSNTNMPKEVADDLALAIECNQSLNIVQLSNNNLQCSAVMIIQALSKISSLKELNLQSIQLTEDAGECLSLVICNNLGLNILLLDNNDIGKGMLHIVRALQQLNSLQALGLSNTNMPKEVTDDLALAIECNQSLNTVQLNNNNLQRSAVMIIQALSKISSLKVLNLRSIQLTEDAGECLSLVICNNLGLNILLLDNNDIGKGMLHIVRALQQLNSLQILDLSNTNMPKDVTDDLALAIECNQSLNTLYLYGNNLQSSAVIILKALSKISSLKELNLQYIQLTEDASEYLSPVICNNLGLNKLFLDNNDIGKGMLHIVRALQQLNSLQALGLSNTNMPKEVADDLALAIKCNQILNAVQMSNNKLQCSAVVIIQALSKISSLKELNLQSIQLTEDAGEYLSPVICNNLGLNKLFLDNNVIGKGMLHIVRALQQLNSLQALGLSNTNMPKEVTDDLALAIECNQSLNTVQLNNNNLQRSAVMIIQALSKISSLKVLNLRSIQLTEDAGECLSLVICNNLGLNILLLDNNDIGKGMLHIVRALQQLNSLQALDLSNTNMPKEVTDDLALAIGCNQTLNTLYLYGNNLQSSAVIILKALSKISSLKELNLESIQLTEDASEYLSPVICNNLGLNKLFLDNNGIGKGMLHIVRALQQLNSLQELDLSNTNMPKEVADDLALAIEYNQSLNAVQMSNNKLQCSAVVIIQALSKISSLKELNLQSIQLTEDAGEYLSSVICNNAGLNQLFLDNNNIGKGMLHIIRALQQLNSLLALGLSNTNMPKDVTDDLALAIEYNQSLNTVQLNNNNLQRSAVMIIQALSKISSLKVLNLRSNQLTEDAGEYLSSVIFSNTGLNQLLLDNNDIGKGMLHIVRTLQQLNSLQALGLSITNMPKEVADDLALAIECNQSLNIVQLSNNNLQCSAVMIIQAVSKISSLKVLNLQSIQLTEDAGEYISSVICNNVGLNKLFLDNNDIGKGMLHIVRALQQLNSLQALGLSNTNMPKDVTDDLALAIECNQSLNTFDLDGNNLQSSAVIILKALSKLSSLRVLYLDSIQLTEDTGEYLSSVICNNVGLNQLFLDNNDIGKGMLHIVRALQQLNSLLALGLSNTDMPKDVTDDLALAIECNQSLNTVQLNNNNLQCSAVVIIQALSKISSLKILNLQSIQLTEDAGEFLSPVICNNLGLNKLLLDNNDIGKGMLHIVRALQQLNSLQALGLSNTNMPKDVTDDLSLAIECNQRLNTVQLSNNNLQRSAVVIIQALSKISSLKVLNLQSIQLTEDAGEYLSSVICNNVGLNKLFLDNNDIGKGMLHIVRALQQLNSLQALGLSNTNMPKYVTDDLALAIECNQSLNTFDLDGNNLQSSAVIILKALSKLSSLRVLYLDSIQLTEDAGEYLSSVICNNVGLNQLFLDNNDIGKGMLHIVRALQQLNSLQILGLSNTNMPKDVTDDLALAIECNQSLNTVQLNNNNLQRSAVMIIQALSKISSLKVLNLRSNQLTEDAGEYLSSVIFSNPGLNQLLLDNNDIGKGMLHIVRALQQLNSLQVLDLSNTNMPKEVTDDLALAIGCNQTLNTLYLYGNNLQSSAVIILKALSKISSLKELNLESIQLTEDASEYLSPVICNNLGLNKLFLDNNDIGKGMLHIVRALQQLNSLQELDLSNTNMPKEVADDLALDIECNQSLNAVQMSNNKLQCSAVVIIQALSKISSLKELNLQSIQLTEDAGEYLSSVICNNAGLNQLFLDNNNIGKGMLHIVRALQQLNSLLALGLSNTNMPKDVTDDLALAIECNQSLNTVQLNNNNLQCSAVVIIQALSKISSLKELNLRSNQLTEDAGEYLSSVICNNAGLNQLFLDNNDIGKGMLHIVKALQQLNSLQVLDLSNTNMPKDVTDDLALAIECNQSLNTVQLNNNNLQCSAVVIIQALSKISSLKELNLRSNQLTEDAGEYLSSVICNNAGLNQLFLDNNDIGKGMLHIVKALQQLNSLQVLDLSNTNMPKEVTDDLALAIGYNQTLNTLYLYGNNLQSSAVIILKALSKISSLKELNLQSIQLTEDASEYLSPVICNNLGLNKLFLDNNDIGKGMLHIVRALQQLNSLQELDLSNTNMPKEVADDLALDIECNQSLNAVQMSNNKLQCSAVVIIQALSKISSLKELNLQSIQLTEDAGEYLSSVICNNVGLNKLFLDNNDIGKGMLHIVRALQQLNSLQALGLSNTNMPKYVTDDLALAIECNQSLNTFDLDGNNLQSSAVIILKALSKLSSLRVLYLDSIQLTEDAGEYLSSVICNNVGLNQLFLDNNDIGKGMLHIVRALQQLNSLQILGLSNTNMPKDVTDDLALAIECNQSLNTVQLNNNNLQRSAVMIIQALSKISSLKVLNLRSNQLTEDAGEYLSSVIFSNPGLNQLLLDNNDIGKGMLHIVRALQQLNSLQVLDLSNTNMPKEVTDDLALAIGCNQTLNTLYLYGNNLQSSAVIILKALSKISSLKELNLESIQLTEDASEYLSPVICNNLGLNKLFLDNNDIGKGMLHIVRALQQLNSLQELDLSNTNMPKEVADDLALDIECNQSLNAVQMSNNKLQCSAVVIIQALSKISSLKELNLQSIQLTEDAGEYLSSVICNNAGLNQLFLDNNNIGKGMLHIVRALQQLNSLLALGLSNTNMPKDVTDDLALAIECNQSLNTVQLNNNNLQCSAVVIIQALSKISSLKELNLRSNQLTEDAGEYLSSVICNNAGLNQLFLDNNDIGKGMLHIVKALQQLNSLQVLDLSNTNMPKDVTDDLALAIECNQSLNTVQLNNNNLQCSAVVIIQALSKISSLKELNLRSNQLTEDAGEYLSSVICNNAGLNQLFLDNNDIGKGMLHIVKALQQLNSLQVLDLSNTNMPKEVTDDLALAIGYNQTLNTLYLYGNNLQSSAVIILKALSKISSLKELNLQSIQLTEDASEYLSPVICNNLGLNKLFLDNNDIGKGMLHIVRALQQLNSLQELDLSNTNMPKEVADDLALDIECNQSLNAVQMSNNKLQCSAVVIIQALSKISSLKELNLQSIQLTEDAGEYLSSVICNNAGLNQLFLDNNNIGKGMLHIVRALQQLNSLLALGLSNTNMPKDVTDDLALAIECNQSLNTVQLNNNNLQCSAVVIIQALSKISSLKELNLRSNQLTEDAGEYLSSVICNNAGLNQLFLDNNDIGKGMLHIVKALQQLNSLQVLDLSNTNMPKEVTDDLALAIGYNQTLNTLYLYGNNLQSSAVIILKALSKISSLKELNLQSIQLTEDASEYLSPVICNNLGLNKLFLDNNNIGKGMLHIVRALQQLNSLLALGLSNTNMPKDVTDDLALAIECNQNLNTVQLNNNNLQRSAIMIIQALSKI